MLLPISILALVYMAFRYPSLLRKSQDGTQPPDLLKILLVYPPCILYLVVGFFSGSIGIIYITLIFLAAPLATKMEIPRWLYVSVFAFIGMAIFVPPTMEALELRRDALAYQKVYPLESLSERLAYESQPPTTVATQNSFPPLTDIKEPLAAPPAPEEFVVLKLPSEDVIQWHAHQEGERRSDALAVVHQTWEFRFQNLIGNGYIRMLWRSDWRDHLREGVDPDDLYLPDGYTPDAQFSEDVLAANDLSENLSNSLESELPTANTHIRSALDFVRTAGWGYVKSLEEVAGFKPHRFRNRPVVIDPETQELDDWRITKLELVSLLKHDAPRVYLSDELPNMETLSNQDVPTRELVRFERRALELLDSGHDLVIDERGDHIRMLGSLRAVKNCLQCHEVPENTLLGAFTYELKKPTVSVTAQ